MDTNQNQCNCQRSKSSRSCSTERTGCPPTLTRTFCSTNSCGKLNCCPSKKVFTCCPKPQTTCIDPCKKCICYDNPCVTGKKECPNFGCTCGNASKTRIANECVKFSGLLDTCKIPCKDNPCSICPPSCSSSCLTKSKCKDVCKNPCSDY